MATILISGATGFVARNFMRQFRQQHQFIALSHQPHPGHYTLDDLAHKVELIKSVNVVINLAGANISEQRWNDARRRELIDSRVSTTRNLVELFNSHNPEAHFISASAVGIYPVATECDENLVIDYKTYANFSEKVTKLWEQEALHYRGSLARVRFGVVLAGTGGAFPQMLRPFLMFAGGQLGNGKQVMPWIALPDALNGLDFIIQHHGRGVYNLVAPEQNPNNEFSQLIASLWQRPAWLNLPEWLIRLIFGEMGQELFLNSLHVIPRRLSEAGFSYNYPTLVQCLRAIHDHIF